MTQTKKPRGTNTVQRMNLAGQSFNRLTVIGFSHTARGHRFWNCRCQCGSEAVVSTGELRSGGTKSCGCLIRETCGKMNKTHGLSATVEHAIWRGMLSRCYNQNRRAYPDYGGRGIVVCQRWHVFENFLADIGERPSPNHSIDRLNNDGNYEPANCVWATRPEQMRNTRSNRLLTFGGKTMCLTQWANETGIPYKTLHARLASGWSDEKAVTTPLRAQRSQEVA